MNQRNTIQRSLVLEAVRELQCHATADEIYNTIVKKHPGIGKGTIYRNLVRLSDTGEIRKMAMPGGADRYDHICHEHYHARCVACGRVFDVEMEYIADLERRIKDTNGFVFTGHDVIFKGICRECTQGEQP
ncbi:MAG: transcriptional repressor [Planctomycetota bacterium]|jgi:Fur family ferric uptake transcriptional regulator/Fur family peroxide stress response transcriptional regulator|nr:transcriptional repressor [Planctomycetota bacterium]